jgi:hypothetical protein
MRTPDVNQMALCFLLGGIYSNYIAPIVYHKYKEIFNKKDK